MSDQYDLEPETSRSRTVESGSIESGSIEEDALAAELRAVTHDLRSSLTGIMGLTALIERSDDAASSRAWATRVLDACRILEARIATINELAANSSRPRTMGRWT